MNRFIIRTIALSVFCTTLCVNVFAETVTYKNQRGSTLTLELTDTPDKTKSIKGTFISAVGGTCAVGKPMPVTGSLNGNTMAIAVDMKDCKKVIAMTGNFTNDEKELHTLWLVAGHVDNPRGSDWNSNITGADHYHRQDTNSETKNDK